MKLARSHLSWLEPESIHILREAVAEARNPVMRAGLDSYNLTWFFEFLAALALWLQLSRVCEPSLRSPNHMSQPARVGAR